MPRQPHDSAGSDMETEYRQGLFMLISVVSFSLFSFPLSQFSEICKERNSLYEKQNDLKGQKQKIEKLLER